MLAAYDRAAAGSVERILLTGAWDWQDPTLGGTAREAQARGALVQDHITEERPGVPWWSCSMTYTGSPRPT